MSDGKRPAGSDWLAAVSNGTGPIYSRIVAALARARATGTLQPGDRLPTQRAIADMLDVDLTTVTRALTEARRRNLIDAAPGRGTFVAAGGEDEPILDLSMNIPPVPRGLNLPLMIRNGVEAILKRSSADALLSYHPGSGSATERSAGSMWLSGDRPRIPAERIVVGAGAQALLAAVILSTTKPGDALLTNALTYPGLISVAESTGRRLVAVPSDHAGMIPEDLTRLGRQHDARLVYLNPTLHNPTTLSVPASRRTEIVAAVRAADMTILEDDPYSRLLEEAPDSFMALVPERVFHVATLAKCISPFLRTAFLVAPDARRAEQAGRTLRSLTLMAAPLMTGLAAEWIRSGLADDIVAGVRKESHLRQEATRQFFPAPEVRQGLSLWLPLEPGVSARSLGEMTRLQGLAISASEEFAVTPDQPGIEAIRISLGAPATKERLVEGLETLRRLLTPSGRNSVARPLA